MLLSLRILVGSQLHICLKTVADACYRIEINSGLGRHVSELTKEQIRNFELSLFIVIQFYSVGLNIVKISFLIQFYRIFPDRRIRQICVYFAFFSFLWMIGQNILYALSCVPTTGVVNNPHLKDICVPTLPVCKSTSPVSVFLHCATCLL